MKLCAALLIVAHAAVVQAQTGTTATSASTARATPTQAESVDHSLARHWGLTLDDYRRYQALMKGVRGAISGPGISPIEVLGIHARDDAERRRYAEMFARLMAEDTQRVLQFQVEYDRAFRRLHPQLVAFDSSSARPPGFHTMASATRSTDTAPVSASSGDIGGMSRPPSVAPGDRVLVFTRADCPACDDLVQRAAAAAGQGVAVDLYLVGARSIDEAQAYARRVALDASLVNAGRVTLNLDGGTLARVLPRQQELPALVRKRGGSLSQLAPSDL